MYILQENIENTNDSKKSWVAPSYELISKDVVKGGVSPGPESASPLLQSS